MQLLAHNNSHLHCMLEGLCPEDQPLMRTCTCHDLTEMLAMKHRRESDLKRARNRLSFTLALARTGILWWKQGAGGGKKKGE